MTVSQARVSVACNCISYFNLLMTGLDSQSQTRVSVAYKLYQLFQLIDDSQSQARDFSSLYQLFQLIDDKFNETAKQVMNRVLKTCN